MALIIPYDCPFCETKRVSFVARFEWMIPGHNSQKMFLGICNACSQGVTFLLRFTRHLAEFDFGKAFGDLESHGMFVLNSWPNTVATTFRRTFQITWTHCFGRPFHAFASNLGTRQG